MSKKKSFLKMTCVKCNTPTSDCRLIRQRAHGLPPTYSWKAKPWCAECRTKNPSVWKFA